MSPHHSTSQGERLLLWASALFGAVALLLFLVNIGLIYSNQRRQDATNERQQAIDAGTRAQELTTRLCRVLAQIAVEKTDDAIRTTLRAEGCPNWNEALDLKKPAATKPGAAVKRGEVK